jgi:type I restriction enzyme, R subunit
MTYNEADTRSKLIDPALHGAGWTEDLINREHVITKGRLFLVGDHVHQETGLRADYLLSHGGIPLAVVEAKDEDHAPGAGLQQGKEYARLLDLQFAYSSNGHGFVEFDFTTNTERNLEELPSPEELFDRFMAFRGIRPASDPLLYPYFTTEGRYPRYYQDVAIRKTIESILHDKKRLLLALATGTGKTFIASQLVWKLHKTGVVRRVLFLADRVFLRDQAYNEFSYFSGRAGDPRYVIDGDISPHYDLYFGIYQGMYAERDAEHLFKKVPPDFFDLIIIDECHRSGFGTWREILDYFGEAIHLGLTATPKRTDNVDTYAYFGESVYSYSLGQGIGDGFLATYKVQKVRTNLDEAGGINVENAVLAGAELFVPEGSEDRLKEFYSTVEFEQKIALPDWTDRICEHLAATLNSGDPLEKTIIYCVNIDHALEVRQRLQNQFAHLGYDDYAVRIVSEESYARSLLEKFRDPLQKSPVVATTVDLLTTGIDVPSVRNIVLIKPIASVVAFKQIIGRGTRLDPATDKKWFRIIDYVNATRLIDEWDRPLGDQKELPPKPWIAIIRLRVVSAEDNQEIIGAHAIAIAAPNEQRTFEPDQSGCLIATQLPAHEVSVQIAAPGFRTRTVRLAARAPEDADEAVVTLRPEEVAPKRIVLTGVEVEVAQELVFTVDATGRQLTLEQYLNYARETLLERVMTRAELQELWVDAEKRHQLLTDLESRGVHPGLLADLNDLPDADAYDVLANLAFGDPLVRREERMKALMNKNASWLEQFDEEQHAIVLEILDTYRVGGVEQLSRQVLALDRFRKFGGPLGVARQFGGTGAIDAVLGDLQRFIYEEGQAA